MLPSRHLLLCLTAAAPSSAWRVEYLATVDVYKPLWGDTTSTLDPVTTTAPLTVSPTSTSTGVGTDYLHAISNGYGVAEIKITTELHVLPNITNLPVSGFYLADPPVETTKNPTITTHYYAPMTISNPASCTQTAFTYTDSVGIRMIDKLTAQATESSMAAFVTTYVSTISTNLGGQEVTTSRCDVYLNSGAIPNAYQHFGNADFYLTECVDPRRSTCSEGGNQEATGSGGCNGVYPPTGAAGSASATDSAGSDPSPTGGAGRALAGRWHAGAMLVLWYLVN